MKTQKFAWIFLLVVAFLVAAACNLVKLANPVDDIASEIEGLTTQIPMDEIEEGLENLATEIPSGLEDLGDVGDLGDMQATIEAFGTGEAPADIPVVEAPKESFFGSEMLVSYATTMPFDEVLAFYQTEMPKNDWTSKSENDVFSEKVALLNFSKPDRDVIVTLSFDSEKEMTIVMVTIQAK